jgi:hypothetical protein
MRNDVHSPKNLVTEDYIYVGAIDSDNRRSDWVIELITRYASTEAGAPHGDDIAQCDHCGARLRYIAVLRHTTGQYISVGETCLENRFARATSDFHALRREAKLDRERAAARAAAVEFISHTTETEEGLPVDWPALNASENAFVQDVLRKLTQWGSISARQLSAIVGAVKRDAERAAAPVEVWAEVPTVKRAQVTGTVLTVKGVDSEWGFQVKILVRVEGLPGAAGAVKLWGTAPAAISSVVGRGDVVEFTAGVKPSDRDATFGLFSRPTGARRVLDAAGLDAAEAEAEGTCTDPECGEHGRWAR